MNIGLIDANVRYALDHGYDVIAEGIMDAGRYGDMLRSLTADHEGLTLHYYFDIPFEETVARHATRTWAHNITADMMRDWYRDHDVLPASTSADRPGQQAGGHDHPDPGRSGERLVLSGDRAVPLEG